VRSQEETYVQKSDARELKRDAIHRGAYAPLIGAALLLGLPAAYAAADPEHGEQLARRWCAACHVVANDQTHGTDNVPTFAAIAHIPGFDAGKIASFLRDPHPVMPDMQLSTTESADLAAWLIS
jgi:mono/diheme cytochrome c family protein